MIEVFKRLHVGNESSCRPGDSALAVVHACKSPCHQRRIGYQKNLERSHPNYLALQEPHDLYLNIIDPPVPLFMPETFNRFLDFAGQHWNEGRQVLIHCNQGESRAPSLAMLLMAKRLGALSNDSFESTASEFIKVYPNYRPGAGIQTWLRSNWASL